MSNQIQNLKQIKNNRNLEKINSILNKLEKSANDNTNMMPIIIEAVKADATLGEISDTLRKVFGEYKG